MYGYGYSLYNRTPFLGGGGAAPVNSVAPVISGTQTVGQTLTSTTGTWTGIPAPTFTYQWYRGASLISGATSSTYVLVQADAGNTTAIKCVVTATNSAGAVSADSNTLTGILDANAAAYLTATGITGTTQRNAVNTLNIGLKQDGLWSKMKAVYPFVTDNRNLLGYTEDFGNAYWEKGSATISANAATAPNGTLTADKFQEIATNDTHQIYIAYTGNIGVATISLYAKKAERSAIQITSDQTTDPIAFFNLDTGVVHSSLNCTPFIENVGNGWYRCGFTYTIDQATSYPVFRVVNSNFDTVYTGTAGYGVYIWGAQLELGSTATTYQPIATTQQAFISNQFKYNLVNPVDSDAAFRLVFNGGWTHSANGALPNGTNGWANTYLQPSSVLTQNSTHLSFYSRTQDTSKSGLDISSFTLAPAAHLALTAYYNSLTTGISVQYLYPTDSAIGYSGSTQGLFIGSRINSTSNKLYRNAAILGTRTTANTTFLPTNNIAIAANGQTGSMGEYQNRQCAFASIGNGLTDTEASNLYTRVQAFQTALSRQV